MRVRTISGFWLIIDFTFEDGIRDSRIGSSLSIFSIEKSTGGIFRVSQHVEVNITTCLLLRAVAEVDDYSAAEECAATIHVSNTTGKESREIV
jgi:hypothetical protein